MAIVTSLHRRARLPRKPMENRALAHRLPKPRARRQSQRERALAGQRALARPPESMIRVP
jgi:hypothetical protein